jgi:PQQ-dependent dehydrogenase (s-GDH family)
MKRGTFSVLATLSAVLFATLLWGQGGPESAVRGDKRFGERVLISDLAGPWELTWGPDNMLWVTERTGKRVTRVDPKTGAKKVAITIDEVSAPGAQDGLLGMALHPDLLRSTGNDSVYVFYTYQDRTQPPDPTVADPNSPYKYLYAKIVRLTYNRTSQTLASPVTLVAGLPVGNDHVAGRLKIGPDRKLYLTLGDQGNNQLGNYCLPIEAQRLPTPDEMAAKNYISYVGKSLRFNLDGSIPNDNPVLAGVMSHVFTYGHRNPQGLDFGPDGTLYSSEEGPKTDDEVNILKGGSNYGWPYLAGKKDGNAYEYARWADSTTPCSQLRFSDVALPPSVPRQTEATFTKLNVEPIATLFTVPSGYNFQDPICKGVDFICWPTVGASSIEHYPSSSMLGSAKPIHGWDKVLLVTTLKRGSLYVIPLAKSGQAIQFPIARYFQSENRYRDTAISPDGRTIYIATDATGTAEAIGGGTTTKMQNPGAILAFTYVGENDGRAAPKGVITGAKVAPPASNIPPPVLVTGAPPNIYSRTIDSR